MLFLCFFIFLCAWVVMLGVRLGRVTKPVPINFNKKFNHLLDPNIYSHDHPAGAKAEQPTVICPTSPMHEGIHLSASGHNNRSATVG